MGRGGKRPGAGRPKGSGKYGEPTRAIRLPLSVIEQLERSQAPTLDQVMRPEVKPEQPALGQVVPLFMMPVAAGFPSAVDDDIEAEINLNDYLAPHPATTFLVRATGDSMIRAGIHSGDMLVVDRSLSARDQKIVIAVLNGELTVKRLHYEGANLFLMPENPDYPAIAINDEMDLQVWGVVTHVIHAV